MPNQDTFPLVLRQYRRAADLTQEQLAELVGCAVATLRAFESGRRRPSRELAERLAQILAVPEAMHAGFIGLARGSLGDAPPPPEDPPAALAALQAVSERPRFQVTPPTSQLIGRRSERAQIIELLTGPQARLVTLLGPGGVGKTSLGLHIGSELDGHFADGVAFVGLSSVAEVAHVAAAIADVLGCPLSGVAPPEIDLATFLRERELLLVLDNLEHLLAEKQSEPLISLLRMLLEQVPYLRILATSRERLRMRDEWVVELDGLNLPNAPGKTAIEQSDAVLLFVARARQAGGDFALTAENRQAVAQLCRTLEGMPLGIELAAAWVNVLTCSEIAQEISRNQELLTSNVRDIPLRHRSLRAVFDHSWGLLNADERRTLRRLSVFRGRFSREAAAMVLAESPTQPHAAIGTLALLASLVDKSLLRIRSDHNGQSAYDLHEQIRQYAAARLAEDRAEHALAQACHALYYARWAEQQEHALKSAAQRNTLIAMNQAIDNLRAAWQWALAQPDAALLVQMIYSLGWFYEIQGRNREYAQLLAQGAAALHARANAAEASRDEQRAYWLLVSLEGWASSRFDPVRALESMQSALTPLRTLGDDRALFQGLITPAYLAVFSGDQAAARALLHEAIAAAERAGYRWGVATALAVLAVLEVLYSDAATAQQQLAGSLQAARACGDPRHIALMLNYSGVIALQLNNLSLAESLCREALSIGMTQRDRYQIGLGMLHLGLIGLTRADQATAVWLLREALAVAHEINDHWLEAQVLGAQGRLHAASNPALAIELFCRALKVSTAAPPVVGLDLLAELAEYALADKPAAALAALHYLVGHPLARPATRQRAATLIGQAELSVDPPHDDHAQQAAAYADRHPSSFSPLFSA